MADQVTKRIGAEDDIPTADEKQFLELEEQRGIVELELTEPVELSDKAEPADTVQIKAPSTKQINQADGDILALLGACVLGINPKDIENLHGRDYMRLQRITSHFLR